MLENDMDVLSSENCFWFRLIRDKRWSRKQKHKLLLFFGGPKEILLASTLEIELALGEKYKPSLAKAKRFEVERDDQWLKNEGNHFIHCFDERFPSLLKQISDPPLALFAIGDIDLLAGPCVAIVGSRRPTQVGAKVAADISASLARWGIAVVSGLALGIDGLAHGAALRASGPSIAVLGCGLDIVYPSRNKELYTAMQATALVVSEYPLGFAPTKYSFPDRNRLVSGLSEGVVIIEAAERSGTLITARHALDQDRDVMVVPGPAVSSQYAGSHQLIRDGAALICSGQDVLNQLSSELRAHCDNAIVEGGPYDEGVDVALDLGLKQKAVLELFDYATMGVDSVIEKSSLTAAEVSAILLELELNGCVAKTIDGGYAKIV